MRTRLREAAAPLIRLRGRISALARKYPTRLLSNGHELNRGGRGVQSPIGVLLFVDFARPLKGPLHRLNQAFLDVAAFAPFLREAGARQRTWEKAFYRGNGRPDAR